MKKPIISLICAGGCICCGAPVSSEGQSIIHTGKAADWTFFYDRGADAFEVVFRDKGATVWNKEAGQVLANVNHPGADALNDYRFDTLTVHLMGREVITANGIDYFVSSRGGSSEEPDLGIRTRLNIDSNSDPLFSSFSLTLDTASSTMPGHVSLFQTDEFGIPEFRLETADNLVSHAWPLSGHSHWHWGFSEQGNYNLVFNLQGEFDDGSGLSGIGVTTLNFEVIPEPSAVGAILGLGVLAGVLFYRRRRNQ